MGCSVSRPAVHFVDDPSDSPKVTRAFSLPTPLVHHPPLKRGDTHHLVSLTSTTYGSLLHSHSPPQPDSLSPHSVINAWELMDGLEDDSDFPLAGNSQHNSNLDSKPFQSDSTQTQKCCDDNPKNSLSKPLWKYLSEESLLSKMEPNVGRSAGVVEGKLEDQVLIYFTSLRGIRKTYEDCCTVRMIVRGFRVAVDERDISMDCNYRKEVQRLLGGKPISLPRVFIRGRHVGGVEEIKVLNESGELGKLLAGFPLRDPGRICEQCGDARFMPCPDCSGSRKIFEEATRQLRRCPDCNENGLVRCPSCCSS